MVLRSRLELLDVQVMLVMTVRRHASETLISMDLRANRWPVSSRDRLRRSLQRLEGHRVLVHDREARLWALVSYEKAKEWCARSRETLRLQTVEIRQHEDLIDRLSVGMEQLEDQVAGEGSWPSRWIKTNK